MGERERERNEKRQKIEKMSQFIIRQMACVLCVCVCVIHSCLIFLVAVIFISHITHIVVDCVAHLNLCLINIIIMLNENEINK